jgi:hypothetical protein
MLELDEFLGRQIGLELHLRLGVPRIRNEGDELQMMAIAAGVDRH